MYGIYEAGWYGSWKVELRLDNAKYEAANDGNVGEQQKIIRAFKKKASSVHNQQLEATIFWDNPQFDIHWVRHAAPPKKKLAKAVPEPPSGGCDCTCNWCDIGNHCGSARRKCNL